MSSGVSRAIAADPTANWAIAQRADTYRDMKRYADALAEVAQVLKSDANAVWALARRAWTYRAMNRYDDALADLDRVIDLCAHPDQKRND